MAVSWNACPDGCVSYNRFVVNVDGESPLVWLERCFCGKGSIGWTDITTAGAVIVVIEVRGAIVVGGKVKRIAV